MHRWKLAAIDALKRFRTSRRQSRDDSKEIQSIVAGFQKAVDAYLIDDECAVVVASSAVNTALNNTPVGSAVSFAGLLKRDVDAYFVGKNRI